MDDVLIKEMAALDNVNVLDNFLIMWYTYNENADMVKYLIVRVRAVVPWRAFAQAVVNNSVEIARLMI